MPNYRYQAQNPMRRPSCGCQGSGQAAPFQQMRQDKKAECPADMQLAMAYVPWQEWKRIFELEKGFHSGTIFEELYKPFLGAGGRC